MRRSHFRWLATICVAAAVVLSWQAANSYAGGAFFQNRGVGGVAIDADGVVEALTVQDQRDLDLARQQAAIDAPAALEELTDLRAVSLKNLEQAVAECRAQHKPLPPEIEYLAGLQRVRYLFVYPERGDIVLAGPAEGWKIDRLGNVVGLTTNRPVLAFDDLIVALRSGATSRTNPITCSIDPTPQGMKELQRVMSRQRTIGNPDQTKRKYEEALGPQQITVTGVPPNSRFARIMVAADFRMKRLAMDFEPSPIGQLPSFLEMVAAKGRRFGNAMPRWWLAPNYDPIATTEDGLSWELRGPGVKCLTEDDYIEATGEKRRSGQTNPLAEKWASTLTEHFGELSMHDSSFGELRNIMDLSVVGALIQKEDLLERAGLEIPRLLIEEQVAAYPVPRKTSSKVSMVRHRGTWAISASGGVELQPWHVASETERVPEIADVRYEMASDVPQWWWE